MQHKGPSLPNVRGMLLEEAVLWLLEGSGYQTVFEPGNDPTLQRGTAGLMVRGRGALHQIDAIADFRIHHPFSYPQRLLLEAKCFREADRVSLEIVRGAVGVLKDVNEYWVVNQGDIPKQRYHYQYALFSASGYSHGAQTYAFAQDIYLIPLGKSRFFAPVLEAIRGVRPAANSRLAIKVQFTIRLSDLREIVRKSIRQGAFEFREELARAQGNVLGLNRFLAACRRIKFALLAVLGSGFPIFLVPAPLVRTRGLRDEYSVIITRDDQTQTWYLRERSSNRILFSFDLPHELLLRYARQGVLTPQAALDLKRQTMSNFHAFFTDGAAIRLIQFRLDYDWLDQLENELKSSTL